MGLFSTKKLIGTVKIKFYGENKALVTYETDVIDPEFVAYSKIELFAMYYAKTLYNLGKSQHSELLIEYIQKAIDQTIKNAFVENKETGELGIVRSEIKRPNILGSDQELVDSELGKETKTYTGELY